MEKRFFIEDMSCAHCMAKINNKLKEVKGLKYNIDISNKTLNIKSKKEIDVTNVINKVASAGYTAVEIAGE